MWLLKPNLFVPMLSLCEEEHSLYSVCQLCTGSCSSCWNPQHIHIPVLGLPQVVEHTRYPSRAEFDSAVDQVLQEFSVELICLAGFMRILSGPFVKKWEGEHSWGGSACAQRHFRGCHQENERLNTLIFTVPFQPGPSLGSVE